MKQWLRDQWLPAVAIGFLVVLGAGWVTSPEMVRMTGDTMGQPYQVSVQMPRWRSGDRLHSELRDRIRWVESTVDDTDPLSEISRLNATSTREQNPVVAPLFRWLLFAKELADGTGNAYDPTTTAVMELWGIGTPGAMVPLARQLSLARRSSGLVHVRLESGCVSRDVDGLKLSLAGIRDGIVADAIAETLRAKGYRRFFIEVGDAVVVGTPRPGTTGWTVGVGVPAVGATAARGLGLVSATGQAVASCVKDRHVLVFGGSRYSGIIDGRTMQPVTNNVLAVTVIASNAALAQGLAVALSVTGPEIGRRIVSRYPGVRAMWLVRDDDGKNRLVMANGFDRYFSIDPDANVATSNAQ